MSNIFFFRISFCPTKCDLSGTGGANFLQPWTTCPHRCDGAEWLCMTMLSVHMLAYVRLIMLALIIWQIHIKTKTLKVTLLSIWWNFSEIILLVSLWLITCKLSSCLSKLQQLKVCLGCKFFDKSQNHHTTNIAAINEIFGRFSPYLGLALYEIFKNKCLFELSYGRLLSVSLLLFPDREKYAENLFWRGGGNFFS